MFYKQINGDQNFKCFIIFNIGSGVFYREQCYFQGPDRRTFDKARQYCQDLEGDLAIMPDHGVIEQVTTNRYLFCKLFYVFQ